MAEGIQDAETVELGLKVFANLTRDVGFKIVFGTEGQSENLLMTLLNRLLGLKIVSLEYLPTERVVPTSAVPASPGSGLAIQIHRPHSNRAPGDSLDADVCNALL